MVRDLNWAMLLVGLLISPLLIGVFNGIPNYIALLKTRYAIQSFARHPQPILRSLILTADVFVSLAIPLELLFLLKSMSWLVAHQLPDALPDFHLAFLPYMREQVRGFVNGDQPLQVLLNCYPALFGMVWFSMYAVSGFFLKGTRLFDIRFQWFIRQVRHREETVTVYRSSVWGAHRAGVLGHCYCCTSLLN